MRSRDDRPLCWKRRGRLELCIVTAEARRPCVCRIGGSGACACLALGGERAHLLSQPDQPRRIAAWWRGFCAHSAPIPAHARRSGGWEYIRSPASSPLSSPGGRTKVDSTTPAKLCPDQTGFTARQNMENGCHQHRPGRQLRIVEC